MKKILIALLPLLLLLPARAQITHNSQGQLDQNATDILKKASARFQ